MMSFYSEIEAAISNSLGQPFRIVNRSPLSGGCISAAERLQGEKSDFFLKQNSESFLPHFEEEKASLEELAATETIRVPQPICSGIAQNRSYLVLEFISIGSPNKNSWAQLGHQLAGLHKIEQPHFGWKRDNTIGRTLQLNSVSDNWIQFYGEYRLGFQIELAQKNGFDLPQSSRLLEGLPRFFESYRPSPSLLHGDLWSGNASFDSDGNPFVYDPCCYYSDRETDLAFTEFFGGFDAAFYAAYNEMFPLDAGYPQRKALYNLYHCLNHFNLFGAPYDSQARSMTQQLLSLI